MALAPKATNRRFHQRNAGIRESQRKTAFRKLRISSSQARHSGPAPRMDLLANADNGDSEEQGTCVLSKG